MTKASASRLFRQNKIKSELSDLMELARIELAVAHLVWCVAGWNDSAREDLLLELEHTISAQTEKFN